MSSASFITNKPSFITYGRMRFLIIDAPTEVNIESYIKEFKHYHVTDVVRACEPSYSTDRVEKSGVRVHDLAFTDGDPPPGDIIERFLNLCDQRFKSESENAIAVHCVAGLGRAPVLVAIALIDGGLEPLDAVAKVREKRRGAINAKQLHFLEDEYKRRSKPCCSIM